MAAQALNDRTTLPNAPSLMIRHRSGVDRVLMPAVVQVPWWAHNRLSDHWRGEVSGPVAGDVEAAGDPDAGMALDVVEQTLQPGGAGGMANDAHVETDRQHFRLGRAFPIQEVERVATVMKE